MMGTATNQSTTMKFAQRSTGHEDVSEEDLNNFVDTYWWSSDDTRDSKMDFLFIPCHSQSPTHRKTR